MAILLSSGHYFGVEKKQEEHSLFKLNITRYEPFADIHEHYHENAYLSLLINGCYQERNRKGENTVMPGEIIFRPAGYNHANHFPASGGSCLNIELKQTAIREYAGNAAFPAAAAIYKAGAFEYLYKLLYCFVNGPDTGLSEEYLLQWIGEQAQYKIPSRLQWLPKAKAILETELEAHHTIASLAARVHVHPVYLARAFKERTGLTPGEYQLKARVNKALALLFRTGLSITQIAYDAGFADTSHLIRSFRLCYGASPHRFRAALKS